MTEYNVLMMGASYGSLLAIKLLFGGHRITMVCLPAEIEAFNSEGARVRLPIRGRKEPVELDSRKLPGSLRAAGPGAVYNVCDDEPAAPAAVVAHAAALLGLPPPPLVPLAAAGLSPLGLSFYDDNKRVGNTLIKRELGIAWRYPDYRTGLAAILEAEAAGLPK